MKPYRYSLSILGASLVLLGGLALWHRGQVPPPESPTPPALLPSSADRNPPAPPAPAAPVLPPMAGTAPGRPLPDRLAAALAALEAEPDPMARENKFQALVDAVSMSDIPAALAWLQTHTQTDLPGELQVRLIRRGAAIDAFAAAAWAEQMPEGATRSASLAGVAVVWSNQDLAAAARWARELPEGEDRQNAMRHIAYEAARTEPLTALGLATDLPANEARDELVRHAARQWAAREPANAAAWAQGMADTTTREQMLADIAAAWGETDPVAAATLALESLSPGKPQEDAVVGIVQRWVQKEPENAAAWVAQFPSGSLQQTALENVVKLWADRDAGQAGTWVGRLPAGSQRDIAAGVLAHWLAPASPANAAQWAEAISDATERQRQMEVIAASGLENNGKK